MFSVDAMAKLAKGSLLSSVIIAVLNLTACGGGGGGGDTPANARETSQTANEVNTGDSVGERATAAATGLWSMSTLTAENIQVFKANPDKPINRIEASRFLTQATFGPNDAAIDRLMSIGFKAWFQEQLTAKPAVSYRWYFDSRNAAIKQQRPLAGASADEINHAFWANAIAGQDQLRERLAFALSEIFVISIQEGCGSDNPQGAASYYDMLGDKAFGTYREMLEAVALHPVMGCYLSHLRNQKENLATGRVPDENFAREILQLFSIGLNQLNSDGSLKLVGGKTVDTYTADDIAGLAKVFTGWSWDCPDWPSDNCFLWGGDKKGPLAARWTYQMRPYAKFHSTSEKRFLGKVIPANTSSDPQADLKVALDTIAAHPNVAPFISKQLIQRLVTSNPSAAYVSRVSAAFKSSGGNLLSTAIAILMDEEARNFAQARANPSFGKVREPILKLSAFLRAYEATSNSGAFLVWDTSDAATGLGQGAFRSSSVFNFFRPGYMQPGSNMANMGLVTPELQIAHETSVAGYINYMKTVITWGLGAAGFNNDQKGPDIRTAYLRDEWNKHMVLADKPADLVEDINQRLMYGTMTSALKAEIVGTISKLGDVGKTTQSTDNRRLRLQSALLLAVASPEFQIQK